MRSDNVQLRGARYSALPCQYLYNSSLYFIKALDKYNSAVNGEIEAALSDFHKAWDALWQADKIVNNNGFLFEGGPSELLFYNQVEKCIKKIDFTGTNAAIPTKRNIVAYEKFITQSKVRWYIQKAGLKQPKRPNPNDYIDSLTSLINSLTKRNNRERTHSINSITNPENFCCAGYCEAGATPLEKQKGKAIRTWYADSDYNISGEIREYNKWDMHNNRTFLMHTTEASVPGWNSELASDIFKELCNYESPLFYNLKLFTEFRNSAQHDYIELAQGSYDSLTRIINPYLSALIINYLEAYEQVYVLVKRTCGNRAKTTYCAIDYIKMPRDIKNVVRLPYTFTHITNDLSSFLEKSIIPKYIEHEYKTVRKLVDVKVQEVEQLMSTNFVTDEDLQKMKKHPRYKVETMKKSSDLVDPSLFPYTSYAQVAKKISSESSFDISTYKVQTETEKFLKAHPDDEMTYRRLFWGKPRYSKDLVRYLISLFEAKR